MSDREFLTDNVNDDEDETAAAGRLHLALRSYLYSPIGGDSDSPDEATVKCTPWSEGALEARVDTSDSESSSSDDDDSEGDADYRTLTPSRRLDNSTRRDDDFKWMPPGEANGSGKHSHDENHTPASLQRRRRSGERDERDRKSRSSASSRPPQHPWGGGRARRSRGAEAEPQRRWNSSEQFRCGGAAGAEPPPWWPPCWCHAPPPPCCLHDHAWPSHPSLPTLATPTRPYKSDAEDRVRRLEGDKESLQLQVQVLSEQISAQSEKMSDLERALMDARRRLEDAEQRLQKEMLQRSSLETQKLELLSKLSEVRLRAVERGVLDQPDTPLARPAPPRTPPANYGRQIERNSHMYSSLPRSSAITSDSRLAFGKQHCMVVARGRGQSVPNLAEKMEVLPRGSPSPSLREVRARLGSGGVRLEGDDLARVSPRTLFKPKLDALWQTTDVRQWDAETTCGWLESLGLECYVAAARTWLTSNPDARGVIASASSHTIEKELGIKHPLHKKKIVLALADLMGGHGDALLTAAGALDCAWVLRWLEDAGLCGARAAAADAALDARLLHRLTHSELHAQLRLPLALHAASLRRGIQVLRDNKFNPETMIRRATENDSSLSADGSEDGTNTSEIARWSTHRVMQWLKEIDLAEYAPNLRGAGVHGGLMLLEPRFTAELLADLLNIPANKTLLRRHLTQRFNDLLGKEVIQQKRNAEQTLGYQPLTATTKYKIPKKSQSFSLKRKKSKDELDLGDLVCPLHDDGSGDNPTSPTMKVKSSVVASGVYPPRDVTRAH